MEFNKQKYWARRNNTVKEQVPDGDKKKKDGTPKMKTVEVHKPLRGQGDKLEPVVLPNTESNVSIGFNSDGTMVVKNRKYRRTPIRLTNREVAPKVPPRKLAAFKKKQAKNKRQQLKKEKLNAND